MPYIKICPDCGKVEKASIREQYDMLTHKTLWGKLCPDCVDSYYEKMDNSQYQSIDAALMALRREHVAS